MLKELIKEAEKATHRKISFEKDWSGKKYLCVSDSLGAIDIGFHTDGTIGIEGRVDCGTAFDKEELEILNKLRRAFMEVENVE